jgi:hypothetical protein
MGTTKTTNQSTQQATPTAAESEMENLQLQQYKATQPYQQNMQIAGLQLGTNLLTGGQLPQGYQELWGGIDQNQTNRMVSQSLQQLYPQFQGQGLMDSGTAIQGGMRAASDVMNQNAQFNLGQKLNLLNLAVGGQAQIQSPVSGATSQLASQLSGLRSVSGTQTQTINPFLISFYGSLGKSLGSAKFNPNDVFSMGSMGGM